MALATMVLLILQRYCQRVDQRELYKSQVIQVTNNIKEGHIIVLKGCSQRTESNGNALGSIWCALGKTGVHAG